MVPYHYQQMTTGRTNAYLAVILTLGKKNHLKTF